MEVLLAEDREIRYSSSTMRNLNNDPFVDSLKQLQDGEVVEAFMRPLREAAQDWCRDLQYHEGVDDMAFLELGVSRVLKANESGRDFLQYGHDRLDLGIQRSAFFDLFRSNRRLQVLKSAAGGLYRDASRRLDVDLLAEFPELKGIEVLAGDGHLIQAAAHAARDTKGRKVAPNAIHLLNIRNGLMFFLAPVKGDGSHAHELPAFRHHLPAFLQSNAAGRKALRETVMLLDMAYTDTAWWSTMKYAKESGARIVIPAKSNVETIALNDVHFDRDAEVNLGVVSFELVAFNHPDSSTMHKVVYRDPETGQLFTFLTTAMDLAPGLVALLYLLRWRIEKVFDVFKNKLHEQKAWGNGSICQQVQAHFACMTHNLILLFEAGLKSDFGIEPLKLHKKREQALKNREKKAAERGGSVNPLLYRIRIPTQFSCQLIRSLRNAIDARKRLREHLPVFRNIMEAYI